MFKKSVPLNKSPEENKSLKELNDELEAINEKIEDQKNTIKYSGGGGR